jgi:cytochrome c
LLHFNVSSSPNRCLPTLCALGLDVVSCLMQRLSPSAGLALSLPLRVAALRAFFAINAQAQTTAIPAAKTSAERGQAIYIAKCSACHSVDENRVGPAHAGVVGRRAGKVKEYEYSDALTKSKVVWSRANLERWLTDPEKLIPGQRMGYRLSLPQERADVVAYLVSLSAPK